jgi:hypothetical protein
MAWTTRSSFKTAGDCPNFSALHHPLRMVDEEKWDCPSLRRGFETASRHVAGEPIIFLVATL